MHELGLLAEIVEKTEEVAKENNVTEIDTIVLEVGAFSGVIPEYLEECYPAVIEGTMLEHTKLKVNVIKGRGHCDDCGKDFDLVMDMQNCPYCQSQRCRVTEGGDFVIKEIVVK